MAPESLPQARINVAGTVRCEPEWSWHPQADSFRDYDLWFVWAGRGQMQIGQQSIPIEPGCIFCFRPRLSINATQDPRHRLGVCYIHFDFVDRHGNVLFPKEADLPPLFARLLNVQLYEQMLRHVVTLQHTHQPEQQERAGEYLRLILMDLHNTSREPGLSGVAREHAERIGEVMRFVQENPGQIFDVSELAQRAAYSVDHFTRVFSQVAGVGPKEYCIRVRMERARALLRESGMSIQQISAALGYADVFFFSRQFKQQVGMSPKAWRTTA